MADRDGQRQHAAKYKGEYETHASHYISAKEMNDYGFSEDAKSAIAESGNYRNKNSYTNLSADKRQDNQILSGAYSASHVSGSASAGAAYVSPQAQLDRIGQKHDVSMSAFRATGDPAVLNYNNDLRQIVAEQLDGDLRGFRQ